MTAVRVHLPTRATESLWQSTYGAYVAAWTPDLSRIVLVDGYTIGDVVRYEIDDARARGCSSGTLSRSATRTRSTLRGFRASHGTVVAPETLLPTTLYEDRGSLGYLDLSRPGEVEPVALDGLGLRVTAIEGGSCTSRAIGTR